MPWPLIPVEIDEATTRNVLRRLGVPTERTMKYAAHGKQVQRGSEHVADAADETWAQIITDALNGERVPDDTQLPANRVDCAASQCSHEMICKPCGMLWDANDTDPPICPRSKAWNDAKMRLIGPEYIVPNGSVAGYDLASQPDETTHVQSELVVSPGGNTGYTPAHVWHRQ